MEGNQLVINWRGYQHADYSARMAQVDFGILSLKSHSLSGRIFEGVFDIPSYLTILLSMTIFSMILYTIGHKKTALMDCFGTVLSATIGNSISSNNYFSKIGTLGAQIVLGLLFIYSFFLCEMYQSVIKSVLISSNEENYIKDLAKLNDK